MVEKITSRKTRWSLTPLLPETVYDYLDMKASAIIIDGAAQLHLEPENDFERMILKQFAAIPEPVLVHDRVDFFTTQGGYMRGNETGSGLSLVRGIRKSETTTSAP